MYMYHTCIVQIFKGSKFLGFSNFLKICEKYSHENQILLYKMVDGINS